MPNPADYQNKDDFMKVCVPMRIKEGDAQDQAVAACMNIWNNKGKSKKADMSFEERRGQLSMAWDQLMNPDAIGQEPVRMGIVETFADYVVVCLDDRYFKVPYTMGSDGAVEFAPQQNWTEVVETWSAKMAIKAVGEWELDVLALPFNHKDSDGQWFDSNTIINEEEFKTPLVKYQHGIMPGQMGMQAQPLTIGKSIEGTLIKKADGWHIRIVLDKALSVAKTLMDAARKGLLAVSSGSIGHLARLDLGGGRLIPYEKNRPGRIAIWPFAEVSLWERGNGNAEPANRFAVALPVMKAMYREAGLAFPDIKSIPTVGSYLGSASLSEAERAAAKRAKDEVRQRAQSYLSSIKE